MTSQIPRRQTHGPYESHVGRDLAGRGLTPVGVTPATLDGADGDRRPRDMRARARTRPLIDKALRVLLDRYRLSDAETAFALLSRSSQDHNVRLRSLASAVVTTPPATNGRRSTGRRGMPAPATSFLRQSGVEAGNRGPVLTAILNRALEIAQTTHGDLQLVDPALDVLVLESQQGFSPDFLDHFAHVGDEGTACAVARRRGARVSVPQVESSPIFADRTTREVMLVAGSQAVQSTPILDGSGGCVGMISTHTAQAGHELKAIEVATLDKLALEAAEWLRWYHQTIVFRALEHLHRLALTTGTQRTGITAGATGTRTS